MKPVWWDGPIDTKTCPVLAYTPEVMGYRWWFEQTHEIEGNGFAVQCRCVRLPGEGSVGDQDGLLWEALTVMQATQNQILQEQQAKATKTKRDG